MEEALREERSVSAAGLVEAIRHDEAVTGLTHTFYRYPARFSPLFARAAIEAFTSPGDLVLDPFLGGGTVAVEALASGRRVIGCDVSSLSTFITDVKTTPLSAQELAELDDWILRARQALNIWRPVDRPNDWIEMGYQRNLGDRSTWRVRKLLEQATASVGTLSTAEARRFARCVVLRTGQWALDGRRSVPAVAAFRQRLVESFAEMRSGLVEFSSLVSARGTDAARPVLLQRSAEGLEADDAVKALGTPKLIVTSPPYPGVYVTYHRWKVKGRKETPAPFWIAESLDGSGLAHYTMGWRQEPGLKTYWRRLEQVLTSLHAICGPETTVVQMVGFAEPETQLPAYLAAMESAGFDELHVPGVADDGRVWREVPGRRWYAAYQASTRGTSQEVVLFHRKRL